VGFWTFVLAICVVSIAGGIINNWIKARHGYPIEDAGTQTQSGKRTMEAICAENQDLKKRLAEVTDAGTSREHAEPVGQGGGYLWRLNSYWRFDERNGGVYIECESVSLTRGIPYGLSWAVGPFVTSLPRESLELTLNKTRDTLMKAK